MDGQSIVLFYQNIILMTRKNGMNKWTTKGRVKNDITICQAFSRAFLECAEIHASVGQAEKKELTC